MKKIFLGLILITSMLQLKAQSFEISVQGNTGMSHYVGGQSVSTTFLDAADPNAHTGYPNGYGTNLALNYGFGLQFQYTFKINFLVGLGAGYETVSSKVNIDTVYDGVNGGTTASGYTKEHLGYINLNPYIGYRFKLNKVRLDIMPGLDIAYGEHIGETVNVKAVDNTYYDKPTDNYSYHARNDFRLRLGAAAYYQKFGLTASYSRGEDISIGPTGALGVYTSPAPEHMDVFRLGISYRLK